MTWTRQQRHKNRHRHSEAIDDASWPLYPHPYGTGGNPPRIAAPVTRPMSVREAFDPASNLYEGGASSRTPSTSTAQYLAVKKSPASKSGFRGRE